LKLRGLADNTIIGFPGGDGPPYFPMARAIMGGLMFSTVVTLFILPTIYVGLDNLSLWGRRVVRRATGKAAVTSGEGIEAA